MMNTQLWVAIAVPSILVVLSWLQQNTRMSRIELQIDEFRRELNELRRDMTMLRTDINRDMIALRDSIHRDMLLLHERVAVVEAKQQ